MPKHIIWFISLSLFSANSHAESSTFKEFYSSLIGELVSKISSYMPSSEGYFNWKSDMNQIRLMPTGNQIQLTLTEVDPQYKIFVITDWAKLRASHRPMPLNPGVYGLAFYKEGELISGRYVNVPEGAKTIVEKGTPHSYGNGRVQIEVFAQPKDATIRVMNIKEKYSPLMALPYGTYDIHVSRSGYKTYRKQVKFDALHPNLHVSLIPDKS